MKGHERRHHGLGGEMIKRWVKVDIKVEAENAAEAEIKRFSEMTFPEQLAAYESACSEASHLRARIEDYKDRLQIDPGGSDKIDELQASNDFLRHRAETAEAQISGAQKEIEEWRRAHSQPICNPPEATGEYVDVTGEMTIPFTVQLPVELCREQIACDDPAIEAALQAVSGHVCTYIWGESQKPAVVYCDVGEQNVEIESDDRTCLEKDSTRLTDEPVNSGSCSDGELRAKREQS